MGLFGPSPEKKLEKAKALEAAGRDAEARPLYAEILEKVGGLNPVVRAEAEQRFAGVRSRMIRERLDEAERFRVIGDLEAARDRCQTALDLAGDDLPREEIEEKLRQVDSPKRPAPLSTRAEDEVPDDLLAPPVEADEPLGGLLELLRPRRKEEPEEEEILGDNAEELFELHLESFDPDTAGEYRSFCPEFRTGYLLLVQGAGHAALRHFDRLDGQTAGHPAVLLERAHALLLAESPGKALDLLPQVRQAAGSLDSDDARALLLSRAQFLEIEALRAASRYEEAVRAAREFALGTAGPATDSILAWTLIEAGRHQEAYDMLVAYLRSGSLQEEILVPAAQAAALLGRRGEAIQLLEGLLHARFQRSLERAVEVEFPVEAGRRLLQFYLEERRSPDQVRNLVQHLLDHDAEQGEIYRDLLLRLR